MFPRFVTRVRKHAVVSGREREREDDASCQHSGTEEADGWMDLHKDSRRGFREIGLEFGEIIVWSQTNDTALTTLIEPWSNFASDEGRFTDDC